MRTMEIIRKPGNFQYSDVRVLAANPIVVLVTILVVLSLVASAVGVFWQASHDVPEVVTSLRGEEIELYGKGIYAFDSVFKATGNRGADLLLLVAGVPMLVVTAALALRGSLRSRLLLMGTLVWFLYLYATLALGTAYNDLFLVYVALLGTSLFTFILAFRSIDLCELAGRIASTMPRRKVAAFMIFSGVVTLVVWLMAPVGALLGNGVPDGLETNTTLMTHALDIAIIVPTAIAAGVLILRRDALGYVLALSLLVLEVVLAPMMVLQTVFQLDAGITYETMELIGPFGGFGTISLLALWALVTVVRNIGGAQQDLG